MVLNYKITKATSSLKVKETSPLMNIYTAQPAIDGKYPSIIVVMELFGVNDNIREITDNIAELGYVAIAPDFYYRNNQNNEIPYGDEGRNKGFELLHTLTRDNVIEDLKYIIDFLALKNNTTGSIGIAGFSMGGHIAYLASTHFNIAATACFYAGWLTNTDIKLSQPEPTITLTKGISSHNGKILYFSGDKDKIITKEQLTEIENALTKENVRHEIIIYQDCSHGFFCDQRPNDYNKAAHDDSWQRLKELFANEL